MPAPPSSNHPSLQSLQPFPKQIEQSQEKVDKIQGQNNTWYCGAYLKYGFHEDGFASGVKVAEKLGAKIPWR